MFIDRVKIHVQGGHGGNGVTAFRREKFVPRGGPSGGDGGRGGDVWIEADSSFNTLLHLRYNPEHIADRGRHGEGSNCSGKDGEHRVVKVPVGTQIFDFATGELLTDLAVDGSRWLAAKGGRGGFGNSHFATSTNRAPRYHQSGSDGDERELQLELKLLADVGLIGFPNAGKSTLISTISAAKPKIADYPFTTLEPNLGVVDLGDFRTFVVADMPGLIEGAHLGAGLGDRFLRHIERTKLLLHLVDVSSASGREVLHDYETINRELRAYKPELAERPQIVVATKIDALDEPERLEALRERAVADGWPFFAISSVANKGTKELVAAVAVRLDELTLLSSQNDVIELTVWPVTVMEQRQRVAIYGGTFDPVHRGHLEIARRVLTLFDIDDFLFVPARVAPHKLKREVSPALHRYAMSALATKDDPKLRISTVEIDGPGTQYTVDTLAHFRTQLGDSEIFFVLGADSWMEITSWREWQRLTTLATLIVVTRPGYEFASNHADFGTATRTVDLRGLTSEASAKAIATTGAQIFLSDVVMADVSATEIRRAAGRGDFETLRGLVPPEVAEYIRKYQLYSNTHDGKFNG